MEVGQGSDQQHKNAPIAEPAADFAIARELVAEEMGQVDQCIRRELKSEVVLIEQIGDYIVAAGGKRMRPMLVLLSAGACGYFKDQRDSLAAPLAAMIEFIHTATLLHDDVVDESSLRRGRDTANEVWGNAASVLVGDFLYSRAFQMMVRAGSMEIMSIMADTTNTIAEGEVMQLLNTGDPDTDEERYLRVIECKTAKLFEAAAMIGAVLAGKGQTEQQALASFGMNLGTAFQIADDALDYTANAEDLGKNIGDDLAEGKPTLPLIETLRSGDAGQRALVQEAIRNGGGDHLDDVVAAIRANGALDYTMNRARDYALRAQDALVALDPSPYRDALDILARFAVQRSH